DGAMEAERLTQLALAPAQRQVAHVAAVEPQDVEEVEEHRDALAPAALEALEARDAAAVEGDQLAVDDEVPGALLGQRPHALSVVAVHAAVSAREQVDGPAALAMRQAAHPVQLALVDPIG